MCFLNLHSVYAVTILSLSVTRDHVKSSQMRNKNLCSSKGYYSFMSEQASYFSFLEAKFTYVF